MGRGKDSYETEVRKPACLQKTGLSRQEVVWGWW